MGGFAGTHTGGFGGGHYANGYGRGHYGYGRHRYGYYDYGAACPYYTPYGWSYSCTY
jgi:hypothetical protein